MPQPPAASMSDQQILERIASVPHWYHQIEIRPGIGTPGVNSSGDTLARLDLPADCSGLRALDIGARDGFFSFELERRGAEVLAIDYMDPSASGFDVARELLGSSVECQVCNVYDLSPERHGTFDIVLFLGLLYHLRDPLLALDRIWDVCRADATLALETQVLDNALVLDGGRLRALADIDPQLREACLMQFYPGDTLNGDHSNYWAPNAACVRGLLRDAGFAPTAEDVSGSRGIFLARRAFDPTAAYHRRLEKTTFAQAQPAQAPSLQEPPALPDGDAGAGGAALAAAGARAALELGSVRQLHARSEAELAGAREYIASLEADLQRKEAELVTACARAQELEAERARREAGPSTPHPGAGGAGLAGRLRRAADAALRQRLR